MIMGNDSLVSEAKIVSKMAEQYGGSFMKAMAEVMFRADLHNLRKIKNAWPDEWQQFLDMYEKQQEHQ